MHWPEFKLAPPKYKPEVSLLQPSCSEGSEKEHEWKNGFVYERLEKDRGMCSKTYGEEKQKVLQKTYGIYFPSRASMYNGWLIKPISLQLINNFCA